MRAAVVIDYQNVHLTAHDLFCPDAPRHEALIHPMLFARAALRERNAKQRDGYPTADTASVRVLVYRGLPHVDYDPAQNGRCQEQARVWRAAGVDVTLRDLTYRFERDASGARVKDIHGKYTPKGPPEEKGVDVLCALAVVREARAKDVDLVVLASRDTDLVPALDEVCDMRHRDGSVAKIETVSWFDRAAERNFGHLRATRPRSIWNTNLDRKVFEAAVDRRDYSGHASASLPPPLTATPPSPAVLQRRLGL